MSRKMNFTGNWYLTFSGNIAYVSFGSPNGEQYKGYVFYLYQPAIGSNANLECSIRANGETWDKSGNAKDTLNSLEENICGREILSPAILEMKTKVKQWCLKLLNTSTSTFITKEAIEKLG